MSKLIDLSYMYKGNLLNYLVLPLLGFSWKKRFGDSYITAKITRDISKVTVLVDLNNVARTVEKMPNYRSDYSIDGITYIEFDIPEESKEAIHYITKGRIWEIEDIFKLEIIRKSSLDWCNNNYSKTKSSALLQCLYLNETLFKLLTNSHEPLNLNDCAININENLIYEKDTE